MTSLVRRGSDLPVARWLGLSALLFFEGLLLTASFDAQPLLATHGWWSPLLGRAGMVVPGVTYVVAAVLLFGGAPVWSELVSANRLAPPGHPWGRYLALHLLAFSALWVASRSVFGGHLEDAVSPSALVAAWVGCGLATVGLWTRAMLPFSALAELVAGARKVLFAGVAFGLAAYGAAATTDLWWRPLGYLTLRVAVGLLHLAGVTPTVVDPDEFIVALGEFVIQIRSPCSGYQGIGLLWIFLAGYFWLFRARLRFPQVLLLVPIGTVVVWLVNAVRIAALILIGAYLSPDVAVGGFHHNAGALLFCGVALGITALSQRMRFFNAEATVEGQSRSPTAAYLVPLLALVVVATVAGAAASGIFDPYYPARVIAVAAAVWAYRGAYGGLEFGWSWPGVLVGIGAFVVWLALVPANPEAGEALRAGLAALPPRWAAGWILFRVVGASLTVPLAEELAFRGYLLRRLVDARFEQVAIAPSSWLAIAVSSLLFGAMHDAVVAGAIVGVAYALVLRWRGNLADAIIAHGTTNALLAAHVVVNGAWGYWA